MAVRQEQLLFVCAGVYNCRCVCSCRSQLCAGAFEFSCHCVAGVFWPQVEREHMWQVEQILSVNAETGDDRTRSALKTRAMGTRTRTVS